MCDSCPKEICPAGRYKQYETVPYIFKGLALHIHPPCWRNSANLFEIESNKHLSTKGLYAAKETLLEAIMYVINRKDTTIEDVLQLTKIRNML